jgi:Glucokinase
MSLYKSEFRARFEAKGRMRNYLAAIPTYVIVRPYPGLLGAAGLLREGQNNTSICKEQTHMNHFRAASCKIAIIRSST